MYLEVRSIERAIQALTFFDKYLGRKVAEAKEMAVVTRFLDVSENSTSYDYLFAQEVKKDSEMLLADMADKLGEKPDPQKAFQFLREELNTPEPEVIRQPLDFYGDGIEPIRAALTMRQIIAKEHFIGNTSFSFNDIVSGVLKTMSTQKSTDKP